MFARINTRGSRPGSVLITQADHSFLRHDSYIECGGLFELDDYVIEQSLDSTGRGVLGAISRQTIPAILAAIAEASTLRDDDKKAVMAVLGAP